MPHNMRQFLKRQTEVLVKELGVETACAIAGKSKATLGRYYSGNDEHNDRFMPIDTVVMLEAAVEFPHVTAALAELKGYQIGRNGNSNGSNGSIEQRVAAVLEARSDRASKDLLHEIEDLQAMLHGLRHQLSREA